MNCACLSNFYIIINVALFLLLHSCRGSCPLQLPQSLTFEKQRMNNPISAHWFKVPRLPTVPVRLAEIIVRNPILPT